MAPVNVTNPQAAWQQMPVAAQVAISNAAAQYRGEDAATITQHVSKSLSALSIDIDATLLEGAVTAFVLSPKSLGKALLMSLRNLEAPRLSLADLPPAIANTTKVESPIDRLRGGLDELDIPDAAKGAIAGCLASMLKAGRKVLPQRASWLSLAPLISGHEPLTPVQEKGLAQVLQNLNLQNHQQKAELAETALDYANAHHLDLKLPVENLPNDRSDFVRLQMVQWLKNMDVPAGKSTEIINRLAREYNTKDIYEAENLGAVFRMALSRVKPKAKPIRWAEKLQGAIKEATGETCHVDTLANAIRGIRFLNHQDQEKTDMNTEQVCELFALQCFQSENIVT